jgi:hypothetical protein
MVLKIKQFFFVSFLSLFIPSLISAAEINSLDLNDALNYALTHPRIQGKKKELDVANETNSACLCLDVCRLRHR